MLPTSREHTFDHLEHQPRRKVSSLILVGAASGAVGAAVAAVAVYLALRVSASDANPSYTEVGLARPWTPGQLRFVDSLAEDVLGELNTEEVRNTAAWFMRKTGAAGVRNSSASCLWLAGPSAVELFFPPKDAAVAYLEGRGPKPPRFARITTAGPDGVMEYRAGPIVDGKPAADATIEALFAKGDIPISKRPTEANADVRVNQPNIDRAVLAVGAPLLETAFGPIFEQFPSHNPARGKVNMFPRNDALAPAGQRFDRVKMLWIPPPPYRLEAMWLHPIPFALKFNTTLPDPAQWALLEVSFCGRLYSTGEGLRAAYARGEVTVCPFLNSTGTWDVPQRTTPRSPQGRTFKEDHGGVQWGPWTFTATLRPSTGLSLLDVKFKGERVLYELSLQEAQAAYSGLRRNQFVYSDSSWSLRMLGTSLEPGVDCPVGAHFVRSTSWFSLMDGGGAETDPSSAQDFFPICIFEWAEDHTIWRHMQNSGPPEVRGLTRYTVVVRSIATVGNYDYITDVKLREDGEIEVHTRFAGYIESRYFNKEVNQEEAEFSSIVRPDLAGPVHSHLVSWKADFDVAGVRANALTVTRVKAKPVEAGLEGPRALVSKYIEHQLIKSEGIGKSTMVADPRVPGHWIIVDRNATSPAGNPRGYTVALASFSSVQILPDSHPFSKAMPFAKYHVAVTKQHDDEYRVNTPYVQYDGSESTKNAQDLDSFLEDGESLVDQDLVMWIGVGKEHVVRQEDLPLVSNFGVGFSIQPWNFFPQNMGASPAW